MNKIFEKLIEWTTGDVPEVKKDYTNIVSDNLHTIIEMRYKDSDDTKFDNKNDAVQSEALTHLKEILPFERCGYEKDNFCYPTGIKERYYGQIQIIKKMMYDTEMYEDFKKVMDNVHELMEDVTEDNDGV